MSKSPVCVCWNPGRSWGSPSLLGPQATIGGGDLLRTGQQRSGNYSSGTRYSAGVNLGWEIDFWGKFQRGVESADASYFATLAQYDDIQVLMAAQVAQWYVNIRTLEARLQITRSNAKIQQRSLQITERLFLSGNSAELDVQQAKPNTSPRFRRSPTGNQPRTKPECPERAAGTQARPLPEMASQTGDIPLGELSLVSELPANLLRRRPDVRAAERQLAAQSALIGVAESELYPSISLIGSVGISGRTEQWHAQLGGGPDIQLESAGSRPARKSGSGSGCPFSPASRALSRYRLSGRA